MSAPAIPPLPSDRSFGLTFATVFTVLGAWLLWRRSAYFAVPLAVAGLFLLVSIALPRALHPINVGWMRVGLLLGRVVSPVVMGVLYFGFLTPIAVVMRVRGRDELRRRFIPALSTYWIRRDPPGPDGSSYPRQF